MHAQDLILVSVDDHVVEPPTLFEEHLPARYLAHEDAPRLVRTEVGDDVWRYDGVEFPNIGLNAVVGRPRNEYGVDPTSFEEMREGCYDVDRRIGDMNANGVLASLCFPSFPRLCGQVFAEADDKQLALACLQAYNDWHLYSWCGAHPERFIPLGLVPLWDIDLLVAEVRRLVEAGFRAVSFSENPSKLGFESLHSRYWDPFFGLCQEAGVVVCMHIGSSSELVITAPDAPFDVMATLMPMNIVQAAADLVWSPILRKYPDLRIALSEGGVGWLPYFLDKIDLVYEKQSAWTRQDYGSRLPSEAFRAQVITCTLDDRVTPDVAERAGTHLMTWESDYPHSDCDWPRSPERVVAALEGLDDATIDAITHENALRIFGHAPFEKHSREASTVGALRAEAERAGVDVTPRSLRTRAQTMGARADAQIDLYTPKKARAEWQIQVPPKA